MQPAKILDTVVIKIVIKYKKKLNKKSLETNLNCLIL